MCVCLPILIHIHVPTGKYAYVCICVYMCMYTCVCVYAFVRAQAAHDEIINGLKRSLMDQQAEFDALKREYGKQKEADEVRGVGVCVCA